MAGYIFNWQYTATGLLLNAKASLYRFSPSRTNGQPSWDGREGELNTALAKKPITDRSYWEGRYALTVVSLQTPAGDTLELDDIVINLNRQKQIIRTSLVGHSGTIKEYICDGDYDISMVVGVVATDNAGNMIDAYPEAGIRALTKFLEVNDQLKVQSPFFDLFGISRIVITGHSLIQSTDSNYQVVEIKSLSDEDYEIKNTEY